MFMIWTFLETHLIVCCRLLNQLTNIFVLTNLGAFLLLKFILLFLNEASFLLIWNLFDATLSLIVYDVTFFYLQLVKPQMSLIK